MATFAAIDHRDSRRAEVASLRMLRDESLWRGAGIYLGHGSYGPAWAEPQRSVLILGPSRSGKTSSLILPNVLAAPGSVVATSTKDDVLQLTARARGTVGACLLFDPSGSVPTPPGVVRVGWSPVSSAGDWDGALLVADSMVRAARSGSVVTGETHWTERAGALLAPLLHAAAQSNEPMATVLGWIDRHEGSAALHTLASRLGDHAPATNVLAGILSTDAREQSGIWSTASGVLGAYRAAGALQSTRESLLDADRFCTGSHTLYICAAGRHQQLMAPLVVGLVNEVRDAAYRRAARGDGHPPVLLALDEMANIAPLPELPSIVSEGAGQGLLTLGCLQDLSQARARWGHHADAFFSLFGTSVVLPGIADVPTLKALETLAGEVEVPVRSISASKVSGGRVQSSSSLQTVWRPRLPADVAARGVPDHGLVVDHHNAMAWVALTPAHRCSPFRELTGRPGRSREAGRTR